MLASDPFLIVFEVLLDAAVHAAVSEMVFAWLRHRGTAIDLA